MDMGHAQQVTEHTKHVVDAGAITVLISTIAGFLPHFATLLTVLWMLIRIWETKTVQCWRARWKDKKNNKDQ